MITNVSNGIINDYKTEIKNVIDDVSRNDTWLYNHIEKYNTDLSGKIDTNNQTVTKLLNDVSDGLYQKIEDTSDYLEGIITALETKHNDEVRITNTSIMNYVNSYNSSTATAINALNTSINDYWKNITDTINTNLENVNTGVLGRINEI